MTTPPFVVLTRRAPPAPAPPHAGRAVEHGLLPGRRRAVRRAARRRAASAGLLRRLNRWLFRRVEVVVGLDGAMVELLALPVRGVRRPAALRGDPQLGAARRSSRDATVEPWAGYDDARRRTVARSCSTSATPASGHGSAPCSTPPRGSRDEALFLFVGGGARWADLEREVAASGLTNVVLRGYVPKDDTPAVMAGRRPRPHHARRPQPRGDEPVEAPRQPRRRPAGRCTSARRAATSTRRSRATTSGAACAHGDVKGFVEAVRDARRRRRAPARRARQAFEDALQRRRRAPRLRPRPRRRR